MSEKIKVLMIGDHLMSTSGCAHTLRIIADALLDSGKFKVVQLGGAIKHQNYQPMKVQERGDDLIIIPVDGYGSQEFIRSIVRNERPDMLLFQSDPRFFNFLFEIAHEVRSHLPICWNTIWDNYPPPTFNKPYYESNDFLVCISKVTHDIVKTVSPNVDSCYLPHAVDNDIFKPFPSPAIESFKRESFGDKYEDTKDKTIFFWNNRNARRKQSGSLIFWFKKFLDQVGHDKALLLLHTSPRDENGQDLEAILDFLKLTDGQVLLSQNKVDANGLASIYNMVDCTVNIADAEGFGLSSLESLSCGTPVINNMTGGLQEQVTDGETFFGVGIEPASKAIIGSQEIPWIAEDRINEDDFVNALLKIHNMSKEDRNALGLAGRDHVLKNYNFNDHRQKWVDLMLEIHEKHGSWETRKNYKPYNLVEIK